MWTRTDRNNKETCKLVFALSDGVYDKIDIQMKLSSKDEHIVFTGMTVDEIYKLTLIAMFIGFSHLKVLCSYYTTHT